MAVYTKPLELLQAQRFRFARMKHDMKAMHKDIAEQSYNAAIGSVQGRVKTKTLFEENHPYASKPSNKRGPRLNTRRGLPINKQLGNLARAIKLRQTIFLGGQQFELYVKRVKSAWVVSPTGTKHMIERGFWKEIKRRWRVMNVALLKTIKRS